MSLFKVIYRVKYDYVPCHYNCFLSKTQVLTSVSLAKAVVAAIAGNIAISVAINSEKI